MVWNGLQVLSIHVFGINAAEGTSRADIFRSDIYMCLLRGRHDTDGHIHARGLAFKDKE